MIVSRLAGEGSFKRSARLLEAAQYRRVFSAGKRLRGSEFTVVHVEGDGSGPRLGIVAAKRVIRHAVDRNRFKRVIREAFRNQRHELPAIDLVIVARSNVGALSRSELAALLSPIWAKLTQCYGAS